MSSNPIYSTRISINEEFICGDRTPYTYLIGWSHLNKWYYGRRTASGCHPRDFWVKYFTSSKYVKKFVEENGNPDVIVIRKVFDSIEKCQTWEEKVLTRLDVVKSTLFLNKGNAGKSFCGTGLVTVVDSNGNTLSVSNDNPDYINGKLVSIQKGKVNAKTKDGIGIRVDKNDPRLASGELVYCCKNSKGMATVRDSDGKCFKVDKDDPRILSGELSSTSKGRSHSEETKSKMRLKARSRPIFHCDDCNIDIQGLSSWNNHLKSKRHFIDI